MNALFRLLGREDFNRTITTLLVAIPLAWTGIAYLSTTFMPRPQEVIEIQGADFVAGDSVNIYRDTKKNSCWVGMLMNGPPYRTKEHGNAAEFRFHANAEATYTLMAEYAAARERPLLLRLNGEIISETALGKTSDSNREAWCGYAAFWDTVAEVRVQRGLNRVTLSTEKFFPHIKGLRLVLNE